MKPEDIEKKLFVSDSAKYGDKYIEHLLEQYKIYVNSSEKISDRRQKTNEFFLGLNSALVALLGFVLTKTFITETTAIVLLSSIAGAIICYLWYRMISSYKGLNGGKLKVIHAIEARLPLALYDTEWDVLARGEDKQVYWPFTHIELLVPWIFISIYLILILVGIPWHRIFCCLHCLLCH
ncbi:MAG: hypothetical protein JSS76_00425 [Bacteroidetes bacterium]|nr:hypothetical protein [Bacteroidota bacterium]